MAKSVEEKVEEKAKKWLDDCNVKHFAKNEAINEEIALALKKAPSKSGGKGCNYPDIQVLIEPKTGRRIPVMIEVKGTKDRLAKFDEHGQVLLRKSDGTPDTVAISKFALNGAVHYAEAIVTGAKSYQEVIAIGINGWQDAEGELQTELAVYYVSKDNFCIPKKISEYSDLSFLRKKNLSSFLDKINEIDLTEEEKEQKAHEIENLIEVSLKALNQRMNDDLAISVNMRVQIVAGMIMAGLGVEDRVSPLEVTDLKGDMGTETHDGAVIMNKISAFLAEKNLPNEKREVIIKNVLETAFLGTQNLYKPINGESPLKTVYRFVHDEILPYFTSKHHLDFTGRLFNVLNTWVNVPDGDQNDVVLTPRYVTEFMAKLTLVNRDSYVWDYALGSAGFLVSSMKLMIDDARKAIKSDDEFNRKVLEIKHNQLLGIEKLPEIYLLAVLNMILMQDGSANIINKDSLHDYQGKYEQGENKGKKFPADVFLLNPPYSAAGKGFVFVEKALSRMGHGRAAVLIQENAGSGNGDGYPAKILKHSTLLASIHMADIFKGKSSVRTAVYVFEVGKPHDVKQLVRFIDFDNDGFMRQNRRHSGLNVNLRDVDHAKERYAEVVDLVLYGKDHLKFLSPDNFVEDTITLSGTDWTVQQHRKIDTTAHLEDFQSVVQDYLSWKISSVIKAKETSGKKQ